VTLEVLQRLLPYAAQIRAAQLHEGIALQRVELQVDLEPALVLGEPRGEIRLLRDADAIGVDHHVAHRPRAHRVEHGEELGMQGRLAARELHQVGLALAGDQRVHHAFDRRQRQVLAARRRGIGEADRAAEIAVLVDLDQRQARVLLVVRAEAAIVGAAELGLALERKRPVARLDVVLAQPPIGGVGRDQGGVRAVRFAPLLVPDLVVPDRDLGRHQRQTGLTQRGGLAPEHIGA
jgi:hypothetical protein